MIKISIRAFAVGLYNGTYLLELIYTMQTDFFGIFFEVRRKMPTFAPRLIVYTLQYKIS